MPTLQATKRNKNNLVCLQPSWNVFGFQIGLKIFLPVIMLNDN